MASTQSEGAGVPSNPRRPSLSISTAVPEGANQQGSSAAAAHQQQHSAEGRSPASGEQTGSAVGGSGGQQRNFSAHARSQSLAEHHNHHASPTSPPSAGNESGAGGQGGASDLVRRHHTLSSTSSSRLVRLERSRARLALQGVGLSEEDQDFYIPPSPVRAGPVGGWSDAGHGSSNASSFASPAPQRHSLAVVGESHSRSASNSSTWGESESEQPASRTTAELGPEAHPTQAPSNTTNKRSSFVVLRGAKGDAALTQRRSEQPLQHEYQAPPRVDSLNSIDQSLSEGNPAKGLRHKNSLKPFLEAEAHSAGGEEEWERSLKDERDKEEMELRRGEEDQYLREPYSTPPLGSSAFRQETSSFSHSRANTYQQPAASLDPWNAGEDPSIRRHASLTSFRPTSDANGETLSVSALDGGWGTAHTRLASSEEILGSLSLNSVGFGRSRSGTSPAPLSLPHSTHSHGSSTPHSASGLSHSNSLSSHSHSGLSHSNSLNTHDRGALSPSGFPRSPWSPTYEETKQLGIGSVVASTPPATMSLNRGGSGSSRGSRISEEVGRLGDEMSQLDVGVEGRQIGGSSSTPPRLDRRVSDRDSSVSPRPPSRGVGRSLSGNAPPSTRSRLPPLLTNLDTLQQQQQQQQQPPLNAAAHTAAFLSRQGPASASAFVPPIGHSHLPSSQLPNAQAQTSFLPSIAEPNQQTPRGNFTAIPGASSSDWHRQKEVLIGAGGGSAFPSAVGVAQSGEAWPAGGGFGVGIAIQQQQQIQVLQNQMQQALSAMEVMRNQGAQIPPGFNAGGLAAAGAMGQFPNGLGGAAGPYGLSGTGIGASLTPPPPLGVAQAANNAPVESPIDLPTLIANKGYNPTSFDLRPANARFFVIKSYTEEDVHKSLKYEIWASTDLGNKRLDRAFRESADKGPIYLFFSVNASGHFAGMAQMLTPVDYQTSSNVWASDKWKGVLKVRWIYIKDVPLASLRHIRLSNTPENKPVTSSRDTQEVPYDAGLEVLRILSSYQSRTSLLQDLPWYEAKLSQTGDKEEGEEVPHPSHYARPSASPQPNQNSHYAPRPQSHSPVPFQQPTSHYHQRQQAPYLPQQQYNMQMPSGPMGMGVGAPQFGQQMPIPSMPPQQQMPLQQQQQQAGGRRFFARNGAGGGPQAF